MRLLGNRPFLGKARVLLASHGVIVEETTDPVQHSIVERLVALRSQKLDGDVVATGNGGGLGHAAIKILDAEGEKLTNGLGKTDVLNVDDSGSTADGYAVLTSSSLTGLDMPRANAIQQLSIDATGGMQAPPGLYSGFSGVALAVVFGLLSFIGFEAAATLGEETANPKRNVPLAVRFAVVGVGVVCVFVVYGLAAGFHPNTASGREAVLPSVISERNVFG